MSFTTLFKAKAEVETLTAEVASLKSANAEFLAERDSTQAQLAEMTEGAEAAAKALTALEASTATKLIAADEEVKAAQAASNTKLAELDTTASNRAAQIAAGVGVDQGLVAAGSANAETHDSINIKFAEMKPGPERSAFYRNNRHQLR